MSLNTYNFFARFFTSFQFNYTLSQPSMEDMCEWQLFLQKIVSSDTLKSLTESLGKPSPWSLVQIQPLPAFILEGRNRKVGIWGRSRCHGSAPGPARWCCRKRGRVRPLVSNLKVKMGCAQLALGVDIGIHAGAFAHPNAL
jgi:hypothetical protein